MKNEIIERIKLLGGNTDNVKGISLGDDLLSITFDSVLYKKTQKMPWESEEAVQPIHRIDEFLYDNKDLFKNDIDAFCEKVISRYYCITNEGFGQTFWEPRIFTPFNQGSFDFEEPFLEFIAEDYHLNEIVKNVSNKTPDIIKLFYCNGSPNEYCVCLDDINKENPALFGIYEFDLFNTAVFEESLEDYLNSCLTKNELPFSQCLSLRGHCDLLNEIFISYFHSVNNHF